MLKCFLQGAKQGSLEKPCMGHVMVTFLKDNAYGDNAAAAAVVCTKKKGQIAWRSGPEADLKLSDTDLAQYSKNVPPAHSAVISVQRASGFCSKRMVEKGTRHMLSATSVLFMTQAPAPLHKRASGPVPQTVCARQRQHITHDFNMSLV